MTFSKLVTLVSVLASVLLIVGCNESPSMKIKELPRQEFGRDHAQLRELRPVQVAKLPSPQAPDELRCSGGGVMTITWKTPDNCRRVSEAMIVTDCGENKTMSYDGRAWKGEVMVSSGMTFYGLYICDGRLQRSF